MKEQKVRLIVVLSTITTMIVLFIGITYSYFTALNNKGSTSVISATSGKMVINYADGSSKLLSSEDIQPSSKIIIDKTFTLTGSNTTSGLTMPYKIGIKYTSGFSNGQLHYYIKRTNTNGNVTSTLVGTANQTIPGNTTETGYTHGTLKKGNKYLELATGEFKANTSNQTITFNLKIQFPDTGVSQDSEKGKTLTGEIVVNYEETATDTLMALYDKETKTNEVSTSGLFIDDTKDVNLRYVGASPKNYLKFNDEVWRIIGIFNVYNDETKKYENLVKIVRNDSLGSYSWDSSESSTNSGYGVNEWSKADLMYELNCDGSGSTAYCRSDIEEGYLSNKTSGETKWFNGQNNAKNGTYDYSKNIKSSSIDKVAKVKWNTSRTTSEASALNSYNQERSTTLISTPSDNVPRNNTWDGKIALIYPSDYGYASTDTTCRSGLSSSNCKNENWLFNSEYQWTLSTGSDFAAFVFRVRSDGDVSNSGAQANYGVRPALFLKSDVVIAGGTGESIENAYTLE